MKLMRRLGIANLLCLLMISPGFAFEATVNVPPICTQGCKTIDVRQFGVIPNTDQDDAPALNRLLSEVKGNAILHFPAGVYTFGRTVQADKLSNIRFEGEPGTVLKKAENFQGEYLLLTRLSNGVEFKGLEFHGLTRDRHNYHWGESGIYIGTSNGSLIQQNRFLDFGDAAIRITSSSIGRQGVTSSNSIVRNNYFDNVTQITTTSNKNGYGGSMGAWVDHNEFHNLKGSVKFATRMPGAEQIIITNNSIEGVPTIPTSVGIEVVAYSNVFIENNQIKDTGGFAMNIYSNPMMGVRGFDWGNYLIRGNQIENCLRGIRISAQPFGDNYKPKVSDINIVKNTIHVKTDAPIQLQKADIHGLNLQDNIP